MFNNVGLPEPDGPSNTTEFSGATARSTPRNAITAAFAIAITRLHALQPETGAPFPAGPRGS